MYYGFGIKSSIFNYNAPAASTHEFYVGTTAMCSLTSTGFHLTQCLKRPPIHPPHHHGLVLVVVAPIPASTYICPAQNNGCADRTYGMSLNNTSMNTVESVTVCIR